MDMSEILVEGLSHYTVVYGLNSHKLKDKVAGHWSKYCMAMGDCFIYIYAVGARYRRVKGYLWTDFHGLEVPISEIKSSKEPGPCFECGRPHFQNRCTKSTSYPKDKFQNYNKSDNDHKSWQNYHNSSQSPTGIMSFKHPNKSKQVMTFHQLSI